MGHDVGCQHRPVSCFVCRHNQHARGQHCRFRLLSVYFGLHSQVPRLVRSASQSGKRHDSVASTGNMSLHSKLPAERHASHFLVWCDSAPLVQTTWKFQMVRSRHGVLMLLLGMSLFVAAKAAEDGDLSGETERYQADYVYACSRYSLVSQRFTCVPTL